VVLRSCRRRSTRFRKGPAGRCAISTEYLEKFPDDFEVRWLLNVAHMTLGEYPDKVAKQHYISLEHFNHTKHGIGAFKILPIWSASRIG